MKTSHRQAKQTNSRLAITNLVLGIFLNIPHSIVCPIW